MENKKTLAIVVSLIAAIYLSLSFFIKDIDIFPSLWWGYVIKILLIFLSLEIAALLLFPKFFFGEDKDYDENHCLYCKREISPREYDIYEGYCQKCYSS